MSIKMPKVKFDFAHVILFAILIFVLVALVSPSNAGIIAGVFFIVAIGYLVVKKLMDRDSNVGNKIRRGKRK